MESGTEPDGGPSGRAAGRAGPAPRRQRVAVYGIAVDSGTRVLVVRAAPHLSVRGRWFLPGGGLEHGEDPVAALRREVAEETGLSVSDETLLGVLADTSTLPSGTLLHTVRIVYRIESWAGELRAEESGSSDAVRWVGTDELGSLSLMPYVREALAGFAPAAVVAGLSPPGRDRTPSG